MFDMLGDAAVTTRWRVSYSQHDGLDNLDGSTFKALSSPVQQALQKSRLLKSCYSQSWLLLGCHVAGRADKESA